MILSDMLRIETCAKQGSQFISLDALTALKVKEPRYVDGSIRVTARAQPLITDAEWTDIVHWWAGMSNVLRHLSNGKQVVEGHFPDWPGTMLFEVAGDRLTWSLHVPETRSVSLERVPALRILMREYGRFFERMKVLNPSCTDDYDVALAYMSHFKAL